MPMLPFATEVMLGCVSAALRDLLTLLWRIAGIEGFPALGHPREYIQLNKVPRRRQQRVLCLLISRFRSKLASRRPANTAACDLCRSSTTEEQSAFRGRGCAWRAYDILQSCRRERILAAGCA